MDSIDEGWRPLVRLLIAEIDRLNEGDGPEIRIAQIKEKFGGLRFYTSCDEHLNPEYVALLKLVTQVEVACSHICEACGSTAEVTSRSQLGKTWGWVKTYCALCHHKRDAVELAKE